MKANQITKRFFIVSLLIPMIQLVDQMLKYVTKWSMMQTQGYKEQNEWTGE